MKKEDGNDEKKEEKAWIELSSKTIKIISRDNKVFYVNETIAKVSRLLRKIIDSGFIEGWQSDNFMMKDDKVVRAPILSSDETNNEQITFKLYEKTTEWVIHLSLIDGDILEKCIDYMHFKYLNSKKQTPGTFSIEPHMGLEILKAAHFLEC